VTQTGHPIGRWPLVIMKEVADNGLDICEEHQIAPALEISVDTSVGEIVISDNGPGIAPEIVPSVLDYSTRTSSREAYITLSRGAQGNALKRRCTHGWRRDDHRQGEGR
jgi:DNA topoisomerase VI subunit B